MSTGYLPNAHEESCPIYKKIIKLNLPGQGNNIIIHLWEQYY
jgi:hypothetical protein